MTFVVRILLPGYFLLIRRKKFVPAYFFHLRRANRKEERTYEENI